MLQNECLRKNFPPWEINWKLRILPKSLNCYHPFQLISQWISQWHGLDYFKQSFENLSIRTWDVMPLNKLNLIPQYSWYEYSFCIYREGWATCPPGHIIRGLHRGSSNQLRSIQWVTCCKPAFQPHRYRSCYDQDLAGGDRWECNRNGYYLAGIHRGASESLSSIDRFRCCSFYESGYC